jgi:hypothetical protein
LSGVATEGAELKAEIGGIRVELGRIAKDSRERDNEESVRGIRLRTRSGSMADAKELRGFQLRLKARLVHASNSNQEADTRLDFSRYSIIYPPNGRSRPQRPSGEAR